MKLPKITQLPSGAYHARVMIDGRRVSVTSDSLDEVKQQIHRIKGKTRSMGFYSRETLYDVIGDYIEARSNILSPATIRGYEIIRRNRFQAVMYSRVSSVKNWQRVINAEARTCSPKTLKNAWGLVRSALAYAGIETGPVLLPMVITKERSFLEPDEIKVFVAAAQGHPYEIAFLACLHGLRASEMLALDKIDVKSEIRVNKAIVPGPDHKPVLKKLTKNETSTRSVPVFVPHLTELAKKAPDGRLVNVAPLTLNRSLRKLCEENSLPPVSLHELRHSYVSLMYFLRIPEQQAMQFGGYADIQTMRKIYTHLATEDRKNAADKMVSFLI